MERNFERLDSGLLVPAGSNVRERKSEGVRATGTGRSSGWVSHTLNTVALLIQLVTVLVLWWTFQKTVIPIQQKELLAEQAARLEMDNKRAAAGVIKAQAALSSVNARLKSQEREVALIETRRRQLEFESRDAKQLAEAARDGERKARVMEQSALVAAQSANASLESAQWNIFANTALWAIYRFEARVARVNRETSQVDRQLSDEDEIRAIISNARDGWPDYKVVVNETADEISQLRSAHFPPSMALEFAEVFRREGAPFRCVPPDFASLEKRYLSDLGSARDVSRAKAAAEMQRIDSEYASQGRKAVFEKDWQRRTADVYFISEAMRVRVELMDELRNLNKVCEDRFVEIGREFLKKKAKDA